MIRPTLSRRIQINLHSLQLIQSPCTYYNHIHHDSLDRLPIWPGVIRQLYMASIENPPPSKISHVYYVALHVHPCSLTVKIFGPKLV